MSHKNCLASGVEDGSVYIHLSYTIHWTEVHLLSSVCDIFFGNFWESFLCPSNLQENVHPPKL